MRLRITIEGDRGAGKTSFAKVIAAICRLGGYKMVSGTNDGLVSTSMFQNGNRQIEILDSQKDMKDG